MRNELLSLVNLMVLALKGGALIAGTTDRLLARVYPANRSEILVTNGGSTGRRLEILKSFKGRGVTVGLLDDPDRQSPLGRQQPLIPASDSPPTRAIVVEDRCGEGPVHVILNGNASRQHVTRVLGIWCGGRGVAIAPEELWCRPLELTHFAEGDDVDSRFDEVALASRESWVERLVDR